MKKLFFSLFILCLTGTFFSCSTHSGASHQTVTCKKYVACYQAIFGGHSVEKMFGEDAPCWNAGEPNIKTCDEGCKSGLELLKREAKFRSNKVCQ